jgi:hypothetical protein
MDIDINETPKQIIKINEKLDYFSIMIHADKVRAVNAGTHKLSVVFTDDGLLPMFPKSYEIDLEIVYNVAPPL